MARQIREHVRDILSLLNEAIHTDESEKATVYLAMAKSIHLELMELTGNNHPKHNEILSQIELAEKKVDLEAMDKTLPEKDEAIINSKNYIPLVVGAALTWMWFYG